MIQEELTKLADEANDDGEEDAEKDEAPSTGQEVEAWLKSRLDCLEIGLAMYTITLVMHASSVHLLSGSGYNLLLASIQSGENKLVFINLGFWWASNV